MGEFRNYSGDHGRDARGPGMIRRFVRVVIGLAVLGVAMHARTLTRRPGPLPPSPTPVARQAPAWLPKPASGVFRVYGPAGAVLLEPSRTRGGRR